MTPTQHRALAALDAAGGSLPIVGRQNTSSRVAEATAEALARRNLIVVAGSPPRHMYAVLTDAGRRMVADSEPIGDTR